MKPGDLVMLKENPNEDLEDFDRDIYGILIRPVVPDDGRANCKWYDWWVLFDEHITAWASYDLLFVQSKDSEM